MRVDAARARLASTRYDLCNSPLFAARRRSAGSSAATASTVPGVSRISVMKNGISRMSRRSPRRALQQFSCEERCTCG